jgi:hypothetical protein
MKAKDLIAILAKDPEATVVVAGFETVATNKVAELDTVLPCTTVEATEYNFEGNRKLKRDGERTLWLGWSKDYRTKSFLGAVAEPEEFSDKY